MVAVVSTQHFSQAALRYPKQVRVIGHLSCTKLVAVPLFLIPLAASLPKIPLHTPLNSACSSLLPLPSPVNPLFLLPLPFCSFHSLATLCTTAQPMAARERWISRHSTKSLYISMHCATITTPLYYNTGSQTCFV